MPGNPERVDKQRSGRYIARISLTGIITAFLIFFPAASAFPQDSTFYLTTSDQVKLYVRIAGKGNPCVFVHGGPGIGSFIFEATPAAKRIGQSVRMIYFDQRGSGRSSRSLNADYSVKRMEQDMEELRVCLHIKRWTVMGHSFGGLLMTAYARDFLPRVRSLVYVHCALNREAILQSHIHYGSRLLREAGDGFRPDTTRSLFDQMLLIHGELAKKGIEYKIMFRSQYDKNVEDSLLAVISRPDWDFAHHVWTLQDWGFDFARYAPAITCPVLIISGNKDYAVGPDAYRSWHFKHPQIVIYNGAHTSYQEEPAWFASKVIPFLAK